MYVVLRVLYDLIQPRLDFEILAFLAQWDQNLYEVAFKKFIDPLDFFIVNVFENISWNRK